MREFKQKAAERVFALCRRPEREEPLNNVLGFPGAKMCRDAGYPQRRSTERTAYELLLPPEVLLELPPELLVEEPRLLPALPL